jgi:hypothetical protein
MINLKAALVGFSLILFIAFFLLRKMRDRKKKIESRKQKKQHKKRNKNRGKK